MFRANVGPGAHAILRGNFLECEYSSEICAWMLDAVDEAIEP